LELVVENLEKMVREVVVPAFPVGGGSLGMGGNLGGGPGREEDSVQAAQEGERLLAAVKAVREDHVGNMSKLAQVLRYMVREPIIPYL
jgi:cullin 3